MYLTIIVSSDDRNVIAWITILIYTSLLEPQCITKPLEKYLNCASACSTNAHIGVVCFVLGHNVSMEGR